MFRAAKRRIPAHFGALTSSERLDQRGPSERLHARAGRVRIAGPKMPRNPHNIHSFHTIIS